MDRHEKTERIIRIGELLDICRTCPKRVTITTPEIANDEYCGDCPVLSEMRELGKPLYGDKIKQNDTIRKDHQLFNKVPFRPFEYLKMKREGMTDVRICAEYHLSGSRLIRWKDKVSKETGINMFVGTASRRKK